MMRCRSPLAPLVFLTIAGGAETLRAQQVDDTRFNHKRGFYSAPITVLIHSETPGARIRYTLDGSLPTPVHGHGDANPVAVEVDETTTLRAVAYKDGMLSSNVDTQTYIYIEDVLKQPARIPGYPNPELPSGIGENVTLDYEMDPAVVDEPGHRFAIRRGLQAIPSLSLVLDPSDLFRRVDLPDGSDRTDVMASGIYWGGSMEGSRIGSREGNLVPASIELIYPNRPARNIQVDAGVEGHSWRLVKRAFRLVFKNEFGAGKLRSTIFQDAPLNGESAAGVYDRIVLRSGKNRSWATNWFPDRTTYLRDQWARDAQIAMSGLGSHGTFVHLYINGLYWGLYNACDRPDAWFLAAHLGGVMEDWFAVNEDGVMHGDATRWSYLMGPLKDKDMGVTSNYEELKRYLDVSQFADYLILCWYMRTTDWPEYNWFAGHRMSPPSPVKFFVWDSEFSWESGPSPAAWVHPRFRAGEASNEASMVGLWHSLRKSKEFMILFADRVFRHCFRGGALTEENSLARWRTLAGFIEDAVLAESARWGDTREQSGVGTRTRENTFYPEVERVADRMRGNVEQFVDSLRQEGYYPSLDPPEIVLGDGNVEMSVPNRDAGVIYYTVDGTDPRAPGGGVSPSARMLASSGRAVLADPRELKARVKAGPEWSALWEAN